MRLFCWYCHKSVSSELPDDTLFRAIAVCPECISTNSEAETTVLKEVLNALDPKRKPNCTCGKTPCECPF